MSNEPVTDITTDEDVARSRRWFLGASAALAAGGVLAACSTDNSVDSGTDTTVAGGAGSSTTAGGSGGDVKIAATAASLEVLAVGTYKAALDAATANKLGNVPPAVATFAKTAMEQHQKALDAWNGVLKSAGQPAASSPPASLKQTVDAEFAKVTDVTGVAKLALLLEQTAADTYLAVTKELTGKEALTMAGALQSVDQEHTAILHFVLGEYPVPRTFQNTDKAFKG